jgi:hypothetical protein
MSNRIATLEMAQIEIESAMIILERYRHHDNTMRNIYLKLGEICYEDIEDAKHEIDDTDIDDIGDAKMLQKYGEQL